MQRGRNGEKAAAGPKPSEGKKDARGRSCEVWFRGKFGGYQGTRVFLF